MGTIFFLICILSLFSYYDIAIRLRMILNIRSARVWVDRAAQRIARLIFSTGRIAVGLRVDVDSTRRLALPDRFLIVSNHQSMIDIPVLIYCFSKYRLRFVGKKELFRYILMISVMFRLLRHACIDRHGDYANTTRELERLGRRALREGTSLVVFPEGTRARTGNVLRFHSGAVRTILRANSVPVVTVAIDGGYRAAKVRDFLYNLRSLSYRFKVLAVFPAPRDKEEVHRILADSYERITAQIAEWRHEDGKVAAQQAVG